VSGPPVCSSSESDSESDCKLEPDCPSGAGPAARCPTAAAETVVTRPTRGRGSRRTFGNAAVTSTPTFSSSESDSESESESESESDSESVYPTEKRRFAVVAAARVNSGRRRRTFPDVPVGTVKPLEGASVRAREVPPAQTGI
jgi:hypothetical protein